MRGVSLSTARRRVSGRWSLVAQWLGTSGRLWPQALVYVGCVLALCAGSKVK